jgi:hypothetical protein
VQAEADAVKAKAEANAEVEAVQAYVEAVQAEAEAMCGPPRTMVLYLPATVSPQCTPRRPGYP